MQFVDTNIFIRFLTKDESQKAGACFKLLDKAVRGETKLHTTESVIAEIVYILASKRLYNLSSSQIYEKLFPILKIRGLKIPYKRTLIKALEVYAASKLDFEDAVLVAAMLRTKSKEIYSYDRGFDKILDIKRLEP